MSQINYSFASRPFVITAVILLFVGSSLGSIWMMKIFGIHIPNDTPIILQLHKFIQLDGFLTLIIMGIGYMIVPRFRNVSLPFPSISKISYLLIVSSMALKFFSQVASHDDASFIGSILRLSGIAIFVGITMWTMRIRPKLLQKADYFMASSMMMLLFTTVVQVSGLSSFNTLTQIQLLLLFPIAMILGIEYKTMPSFLAFIRPKRRIDDLSICLILASMAMGSVSVFYDSQVISVSFNLLFLSAITAFSISLYIYGGFDDKEIRSLIKGEKLVRYNFTILHTRLAFSFLHVAVVMAVFFSFFPSFALYDLAIHFTAIGFIGITIMLYLPILLPPITGKSIQFVQFNKIPLALLVGGLTARAAGDFVIQIIPSQLSYIFGFSGWLIVAAMLYFVIMIHKSMGDSVSEDISFNAKRPRKL
ncbi:MAG TPA: hypothetical protein VLF17_06205 [Candidatus Nitrosotenuis sp.]|nr:hypothetical protein [Candidatus Nitrosotenuis sp.]